MINNEEAIQLKDLITVASPLIKALVENVVTPKLNDFKERFNLDKNKYYIPTEEHFQEYLHRTYKKVSVINTLVFNNSQRLIQDIYLPLTVYDPDNKSKSVKIDGFPRTISDEYGNILITDTAGMGKSTLMKRIFIDIVEKNTAIPIFIELRRLSKEKTLISEIHDQLNSLTKEFDSTLMLELLSEGGFIIILDGYDEISFNEREPVTQDIQDFIVKASNNRFFITSRPEKALSSFGSFKEYRISNLKKKEAFELLRKYDHQGVVSSLLIKKLEEQELKNIEEFLINPLLVSLLFTAFEHKQVIPFKKHLFYRQVYDANFESHDLTKGESYSHEKYSKLEIDDFHRVLRHIGFNCFKNQKIEFNKDELLKLISESKSFCAGLEFNVSDFLEDLISTVPLFTKDGNYIRWAHKSLQEYFSAQFIYLDSKEKQTTILKRIYNHTYLEKFVNILDLYYDMDYKTFRNVIEYELLKEFHAHVESYKFKNINTETIYKRAELCFLKKIALFQDSEYSTEGLFSEGTGEMMDKIRKETGKRLEGILCYSPCPKFIFGLHLYETKFSLITLLEKKNSLLINSSMKITENKNIEIDYEFQKDLEYVFISKTSEDVFNLPINFEKVNEIIELTDMPQINLDYRKSSNYLKVIEDSLQEECEDDFLLNGL